MYQMEVHISSSETSSDASIPPDSPDISDIFGEPFMHPRVGDEYQVEIPPIISESELLYLMMNPADFEGCKDSSLSFLMGLAIPVMWVHNQANQVKDERTESTSISHVHSSNGRLESVNNTSLQENEPSVKVDADDKKSVSDMYYLVPGLSTEFWSDFEVDCFLLGLYIFGKNLIQVSKFMDSKNMGQILSFYYGRFYKSPAYCKWSECRKMRNKKCVPGHRFFTGYRQQELFSRLLPHMSDESEKKFLEASKAFAEGRILLDDYVSTLKALVGIRALVEAVAIGKGKDDLTTLIVDNSKSQVFTHRPEVPSGKACSSLTCSEIVNYLTGDFRLSKARSNDIFWEAVWPRLLARGWHSEQPRGDAYPGSKNCLVFLIPGIKKFSRRKLARGDHYFDSVSDVLAKVASEPELLELEAGETGPRISKEENGWGVELNSDDDDDDGGGHAPDDHERHCYLKPRVSSGLSNLTKFTVVDTSLANEDNPGKVRELRSLPLEASRSSTLSNRLRKAEIESQGIAEILPNDPQISTSAHAKGVLNDMGESQRTHKSDLDPSKMLGDINLSTDYIKSRAIKHQFSRRVKSSVSNCSGQVTKRRKLSSCVEADVTYVLSLPARYKNGAFRSMNKSTVPHKINQPQAKVLVTEAAVASTSAMNKGIEPPNKVLSTEAVVTKTSNEKIPNESSSDKCVNSDFPQAKDLKLEVPEIIDLNLPQVPTEPESGDDNKVKVEEGKSEVNLHAEALKSTDSQPKDADTNLAHGPHLSSAANKDCGSDQLPRRQSTRNRPLTTKALEALEIGFLNPVRHSRKRSPSTTQDQKPKRSRQPRNKSTMLPNVISTKEKGVHGTCKEKTDVPGNPSIGSIPVMKEVVASGPLRISEASCPTAP